MIIISMILMSMTSMFTFSNMIATIMIMGMTMMIMMLIDAGDDNPDHADDHDHDDRHDSDGGHDHEHDHKRGSLS